MMSHMGDADRPDIKAMSAATYAATADHFDDPLLSFWDRFGRETVTRIGLRTGERVFDACCGTGASALPAAHLVGATGHVLGCDLSEPALVLARAKARAEGLTNTEFRSVDVEHTGLPSESFDAVVCQFGVFFLPDMVAAMAELWRLVRPGGTLAVTVWGPDFLEPGTAAFWAAVGAERPDLVGGFHPWTMVLGTGFRATVAQLDPAAAGRVRAASVEWLRRHEVHELGANVIYARSRKPVTV
jgi:SAM-dependent methyltransferase